MPIISSRNQAAHAKKLNEIFPDMVLAEYIASQLKRSTSNSQVTQSELDSIQKIVRPRYINNIIGIQYLNNIIELDIDGCKVSDISAISKLYNLVTISAHANQISDLEPISKLKNLEYACFSYNRIVDVNPLTNLEKIIWLLLGGNQIIDFSPLKSLKSLKVLDLFDNPNTGCDSFYYHINSDFIKTEELLKKMELF